MSTIFDERDYAINPDVHLPLPAGLPRNATTPALTNQLRAKSGLGKMFGFTATSTNVAAQFVQVFDSATLPANGSVPLFAVNVASGSSASGYWGSSGRSFERGIFLVNSTTQATLTIGAADCLFDVQYV